ncbi:hypothetical protein ACFQJ7_13600 [Halovenus rubra]|uniref:Uncharacterized protein n=2 Tax=Halovenus rubra TaxID=869890 RepID=A0ACC7E196_9EURY|nr:hypothetical protein [Halovenus rubra]
MAKKQIEPESANELISDREAESDGTFQTVTRRTSLKLGGVALAAVLGGVSSSAAMSTSLDELPVGSQIGGGDTYEDTVSASEANVVVQTLEELKEELESANYGDVVFVDGDAEINLGDTYMTIPSGVTLASNRGVDGAKGAHLSTNGYEGKWAGPFNAESDVRVTGLRISGKEWEYREIDNEATTSRVGLALKGPNCEVDNVEMWGYNFASIRVAADEAHIHHSHIHHNPIDGWGYGIHCARGQDILIEYNHMVFNRHSVSNTGIAGYEVRNNFFGGETAPSYQVGTHAVNPRKNDYRGGTELSIHHNTFVPTTHIDEEGDTGRHISIRGFPEDVADIHHNWFYNPTEPTAPSESKDGAIIQIPRTNGWAHITEWDNVTFSDNHYGADKPDSDDIGAPVDRESDVDGTFTYSVEANENAVEYYLEARDGVDWRLEDSAEETWVSTDGTRVAGRMAAGETHTWTGNSLSSEDFMVIDVTIDGDAVGYVNGNESNLDLYPQPEATGGEWKHLDELLYDPQKLTVIAEPNAEECRYEFTVDTKVQKLSTGGETPDGKPISAEDSDEVTETNDGKFNVSGTTENGYGDAFRVSGSVSEATLRDSDRSWFELNGERVSPEELPERTGLDSKE